MWKKSWQKIGKLAEKVWGVTPWRVVYQEKVYGIPKEKSALLVMGGDEKRFIGMKGVRLECTFDTKCKYRKTLLSLLLEEK